MQKNSRQKINCDYLREEDLEKWERGRGREGKGWHLLFLHLCFLLIYSRVAWIVHNSLY